MCQNVWFFLWILYIELVIFFNTWFVGCFILGIHKRHFFAYQPNMRPRNVSKGTCWISRGVAPMSGWLRRFTVLTIQGHIYLWFRHLYTNIFLFYLFLFLMPQLLLGFGLWGPYVYLLKYSDLIQTCPIFIARALRNSKCGICESWKMHVVDIPNTFPMVVLNPMTCNLYLKAYESISTPRWYQIISFPTVSTEYGSLHEIRG